MVELYANNAHGILSAGISAGATALNLQTGQGALFPNPGVGDFFRCAIIRADLSITEDIFVTARTGDGFTTISRGQEGTTPAEFFAGDRVRLRPTAGMLEALASVLDDEDQLVLHGFAGPGALAGGVEEWGTNFVAGGSTAIPALAATSYLASTPRARATAPDTTTVTGWRSTNFARVWRGDATNRGGFDLTWEFGLDTNSAATRFFAGVNGDNSAQLISAGNPSGRTTEDFFGLGFDDTAGTGDTFRFLRNDGSGTPTNVDTTIARNATSVYRLRVRAPVQNAGVTQSMTIVFTDLASGATFTATETTDLPRSTIFLNMNAGIRGATSAQISVVGYWWRRVD